MFLIKQITAMETFAVRHPVLRPGKPLESCIFEGDDHGGTVHLGLYEKGAIAGVTSIFESAHEMFDGETQFQLRGMAVLDMHQKKGYGAKLVKAAEEHTRGGGGTLLWFNAREKAIGFYEKMGYKKRGSPFTIGDIGLHYVMSRKL
jgi:GNAT superfamily N-acetyltransferase